MSLGQGPPRRVSDAVINHTTTKSVSITDFLFSIFETRQDVHVSLTGFPMSFMGTTARSCWLLFRSKYSDLYRVYLDTNGIVNSRNKKEI